MKEEVLKPLDSVRSESFSFVNFPGQRTGSEFLDSCLGSYIEIPIEERGKSWPSVEEALENLYLYTEDIQKIVVPLLFSKQGRAVWGELQTGPPIRRNALESIISSLGINSCSSKDVEESKEVIFWVYDNSRVSGIVVSTLKEEEPPSVVCDLLFKHIKLNPEPENSTEEQEDSADIWSFGSGRERLGYEINTRNLVEIQPNIKPEIFREADTFYGALSSSRENGTIRVKDSLSPIKVIGNRTLWCPGFYAYSGYKKVGGLLDAQPGDVLAFESYYNILPKMVVASYTGKTGFLWLEICDLL